MVKKYPVHKDVVCPFCSLLCDDLVVENRDGRLEVLENGCGKAKRGFETAPRRAAPLIRGRAVSLDEAVDEAAGLLQSAHRPLITGLGCDVAGSRAAMLLAERSGAVIDHGQGDAMMRNLLALQQKGWIMTTLTEVKNRADLILFLGTDAVSRYPRFFERYVWNESSLFLDGKSTRQVAYLGHRLDTRPGTGPGREKPLAINCDNEDLIDYVSLLTAMLRDYDLQPPNISPRQRNKLARLAEAIRAAEYCAIVWSPGELDISHGELLIQSTCDLIRLLNETGRCAGLSLGGDNGGASFMNVCAWQSGFPARVDYSGGSPDYHPYDYATGRLLARSLVDALLWISAWDDRPPRPQADIPTIVLAGTPDRQADVFIPVGAPGLDHAGNLFRTDNVVCLPLGALREPAAPDTAGILNRISGGLTS